MFARKKQPPIRSLLAHGSQIRGDFTFVDGLRNDGEVVGNIRALGGSPSILVISESALVIGEIWADHVIINGRVDGPVNAAVLLELQPKARIEGNVQYKALEMHQGAVITGQLRPMLPGDEKTALKLASNNG